MKPIKRLFTEIKLRFTLLALFNSMISSVLVYASFFILLMFTNLNVLLASIPGIIAFVIFFEKNMMQNPVREIEDKYPDLNERLRTSKDNVDKDNIVVNHLNAEITEKIKRVSMFSFFDVNKTLVMSAASGVMVFLIIYLSSLNLGYIVDLSNLKPDLKSQFDISTITGVDEETKFEKWEKDIYGQRSVALLGKQELNITVDVSQSELDLSQIKEVRRQDFTDEFPNQISAIADVSYEEEIQKDYKEIIKSYFQRIAE